MMRALRFLSSLLLALLASVLLALSTGAHAAVGLFNTGVDVNGAVLALGSADAHYTLVSQPGATGGVDTTPAPVYTVNDASGFQGLWMRPDALSSWLTSVVNPADGAAAGVAAGNFDYQTHFDLSGYDAATASIAGGVAADNAIIAVLLNGVSIGFSGGGYGGLSSFSILSGFNSGLNTLDFVINNGGGPAGVRVEMRGNFTALPAAAVPEPRSAALVLAGLLTLGAMARRRGGA